MIPSEVVELANTICPGWQDSDDLTVNETLASAWAVHNAGYRKPVKNPDQQSGRAND